MDPVENISAHTCKLLNSLSSQTTICKSKSREHFSVLEINKMMLKFAWREFPGSPVVRTWYFQCHGLRSVPD